MTNPPPPTPSKQQALQNLVLDPDLKRLEDLLAEFNLFDVLNIHGQEAPHSALLAWLLDPCASHGLRDHFLRAFLMEAAKEAHTRRISRVPSTADVDGWKLQNVKIAPERHYIDILIISDDDGFVCLIENKIWSDEHSNQLTRYLQTVESEYQGLTPFPIFLTPNGRDPALKNDAERYVPFGYAKIVTLIERILQAKGSTINANVAGFLRQYALILRRRIVNGLNDIDELALQIYKKHKPAIDVIINAIPDLEAEAWEVVDETIRQFAPRLQPDYSSRNYRRFFSPDLDEIPDLKEGTNWTRSRRILLFEVWYRERRLVLQMGPGPNETRNRIFQLVQKTNPVPGVDMRRASSLSPRYHHIYSKSLFPRQGSDVPDFERNSKLLEQAISNFYNNDYWPIVNAIRNEFGLQPVQNHP